MTKRERQLQADGYEFSGHYFRYGEHEAALHKAREYREQGHRAQVVTVITRGQIYSREGYSVYVKKAS